MAIQTNVSVDEHIKNLPEDKKDTIVAVRKFILKHLPKGYQESIGYGMLAYNIPLERYPKTYNKQPLMYLGLAAKKNYCTLHMVGVYMNPSLEKQLKDGYEKAGLKLKMGKGCINFNKVEELEQKTIGDIISKVTPEIYISYYEKVKPPVKK